MRSAFAACCAVALFTGCARPPKPPLEDLSGRENLSAFSLRQVRGTRDGDRLAAEAQFGDGASTLIVRMRFAIGSPTTLQSGQWQWERGSGAAGGSVAERSVMFLGGQGGPSSIGGRFDLLDASGTAHYRINIPATELKIKLAV